MDSKMPVATCNGSVTKTDVNIEVRKEVSHFDKLSSLSVMPTKKMKKKQMHTNKNDSM
jgi:hypothetical protein